MVFENRKFNEKENTPKSGGRKGISCPSFRIIFLSFPISTDFEMGILGERGFNTETGLERILRGDPLAKMWGQIFKTIVCWERYAIGLKNYKIEQLYTVYTIMG